MVPETVELLVCELALQSSSAQQIPAVVEVFHVCSDLNSGHFPYATAECLKCNIATKELNFLF
jgi:hypothetical protein